MRVKGKIREAYSNDRRKCLPNVKGENIFKRSLSQ